jgi:hypothetical protein
MRTTLLAILVVAMACNHEEVREASTARQSPDGQRRAWSVDSAASSAGACLASGDTIPSPARREVSAGEYLLVIVTEGRDGEQSVSRGRLSLVPTRPNDRSARTRHGPAIPNDTIAYPLRGTTDVRFENVPYALEDTIAPTPTSTDPIRPGVLVHRPREATPGPLFAKWMITVGALSNLRDEPGWVDGGGVVMSINRFTPAGFAGTWGPWGRVRTGGGYFCTARVS